MVARKAWTSDTVLVHILKKVLPDRQAISCELEKSEKEALPDLSKMTNEELAKECRKLLNKGA